MDRVNFGAPGALWWGLPLGGAIVALYLLRMRRQDRRVSASFLWPAQTEEVRANAWIQRLKFNWLMVLQLLAMGCLVAGFARPQSVQRGLTSDVTVFVIDAGASMGATDGTPTRLASAKLKVAEALTAARPADRIALIAAGAEPQVLCPLSTDKARLRAALDGITQVDCPPAMEEALRLGSALCASETGARIVVVSGGNFPTIKNFAPGKAKLVYEKIGEGGENQALTALGFTDGDRGRAVYCGVKNYGRAEGHPVVSLFADGKLIDSRRLTINGGQESGFTVSAAPTTRVFEARLAPGDLLAADDYAVAVTEAGSHLHVLLLEASPDPFLEKALALDPRVSLDRVSLDKTATLPPSERSGAAGGGAAQYDLIVFDGVPEVPVKGASLAFGIPSDASPVRLRSSAMVDHPSFVTAESTPLMAGVDLSNVYIRSVAAVSPRGGAKAVALGSGQVPLIVQSERPRKQIFVPFRPGASDLPLQYSFPILISNALDFFAGEATGSDRVVAVGQPIALPANASAKLTDPSGHVTVVPISGGVAVVRGLARVGKYDLTIDGKTTHLYATLRDATASNIAPVADLALGSQEVSASNRPLRAQELWRLGLLATLAVLVGEWWLFARRS